MEKVLDYAPVRRRWRWNRGLIVAAIVAWSLVMMNAALLYFGMGIEMIFWGAVVNGIAFVFLRFCTGTVRRMTGGDSTFWYEVATGVLPLAGALANFWVHRWDWLPAC